MARRVRHSKRTTPTRMEMVKPGGITMMTKNTDQQPLIGVALLVSSELEDEGLLKVIHDLTDMVSTCHRIIHDIADVEAMVTCQWEKVEVVIMMLTHKIVESAVNICHENLVDVPIVVVAKEPLQWSVASRLLDHGVKGLTMSMQASVIVSMVRLAYYRTGGVDSEWIRQLLNVIEEGDAQRMGRLTDLDYHIWSLMVKGYSNPKISQYCGISLSQTKHHVNNIFKHLGVHDREHAIMLYDAAARVSSLSPK